MCLSCSWLSPCVFKTDSSSLLLLLTAATWFPGSVSLCGLNSQLNRPPIILHRCSANSLIGLEAREGCSCQLVATWLRGSCFDRPGRTWLRWLLGVVGMAMGKDFLMTLRRFYRYVAQEGQVVCPRHCVGWGMGAADLHLGHCVSITEISLSLRSLGIKRWIL